MQYGESTVLKQGDLYAVRDVQMPAHRFTAPVSKILYIPKAAPPARTTLEVTSIIAGPRLSVATINGRAFEAGEQRKVVLSDNTVVLR
jgi:hypothetical protein